MTEIQPAVKPGKAPRPNGKDNIRFPREPGSDDEAQAKPATSRRDQGKGISGCDLLKKEFAPITWLLPDFVPDVGVFILAGKQKLGKSWFSLSLALAHNYGGMFLDRKVKKGNVLYLGLEDSERRMKDRIIKLQPNAISNINGLKDIHFFHSTDNVPRLDQGFNKFIEPYLLGKTLLVVDVLQKIRPLKSSGNVYQDDYQVMTTLQNIALEYNLCVLALTHTRKQGADDAFDMIMGSGGIGGSADGALVMERKRGNGSAVLHTTGRDVIEGEHGLTFIAGIWTYAGTAEEMKASDEQNEIFNLLIDAGSEGMTTKEICFETGKNEPNIRKLLRKLADLGRIRQRNIKPAPRYTVCDGPNAPPL